MTSTTLLSRLVDVPVTAGTTYSNLVSRWSGESTYDAGTLTLGADFTGDPAV